MAFIEAALALWMALVTSDHELSLFSCLLPLTSCENGEDLFLVADFAVEKKTHGGL
jgi:hypothetical protein